MPPIRHKLKLVFCKTSLKRRPYLWVGGLAHSSTQSVTEERAFIGHGFALEAPITGIADSFIRSGRAVKSSSLKLVASRPGLGLRYDLVGLISILLGELPMGGQHLAG